MSINGIVTVQHNEDGTGYLSLEGEERGQPALYYQSAPEDVTALNGRQVWGGVDRLRAVIEQHDLCHDLHGKVDARAFANGCTFEQRKIYGCAPDSDEVDRLRAVLERIACRDQGEVGSHMEEPRAAAIAREVLG